MPYRKKERKKIFFFHVSFSYYPFYSPSFVQNRHFLFAGNFYFPLACYVFHPSNFYLLNLLTGGLPGEEDEL